MEQNGERIFQEGECLEQRYRIVRPIGEGGMGSVFLAEDLRLEGQHWAVKWIPSDSFGLGQPWKEAKLMIELQHPALPRIVDFIPMSKRGGCCLVMDYLPGQTLLELSASCGHALHWESIADYVLQLCDLLHYLHNLASPIVFRDVKPSNVIIGPDSRVKLIDFGIARTYKEGKSEDTVHVGSVGFAAPELLANRQTDHRADLYSLGSLIYFLLSGGQYYNFTRLPLGESAPHVPAGLDEAVRRLLCDDPRERYQSAEETKQALTAAIGVRQQPSQVSPGHGSQPAGASSERKIVAVFGLFPGAGTTFVAVALARYLAKRGVRVAYLECPWQQGDPQLSLLSESEGRGLSWQEETLAWRLAPEVYDPHRQPFNAEQLYRLFLETKADVYIVDVSSGADEHAAEAITALADEVIAVAAPDPAQLRKPATLMNWERINSKRGSFSIRWVANRMPESTRVSEFLHLFTLKPECTVAELPYDLVLSAKWNGRWIQEEGIARTNLERSLLPLLEQLAPAGRGRREWSFSAKRWLANKLWTEYTNKK